MSRLKGTVATVVIGSTESQGRVAASSAHGRKGASGLSIISATVFLALGPTASAGEREPPQVIRRDTSELRYATLHCAGKVPVVFVHGLFGREHQWSSMIEKLSGDAAICSRFQFLTFRYDSTLPIPDSGLELALALNEARRRLDPMGSDTAFDQVVLVGHSLGGLVSKAASQSLDVQCLAPREPRPDHGVATPPPRVGRYVFIATPHRGAPINRGAINLLGRRLAGCNKPCGTGVRDALFSVDQLVWEHPLLAELEKTRAADNLPFHSIIATFGGSPIEGATDGLVPVKSAKLEGARSELLVRAPHFCICQPEVMREVGRILTEDNSARVDALRPRPARPLRPWSLKLGGTGMRPAPPIFIASQWACRSDRRLRRLK